MGERARPRWKCQINLTGDTIRSNTLDGGSVADYRIYDSAFPASRPSGDSAYNAPAGNRNGSDGYYASFGGSAAPAAQVALFPGQTGTTDGGETAFDWVRVDLTKSGNTVTWEMDGLVIGTVDSSALTLGGGNILFGHHDTNNSSSSDPNDTLLNVTLIAGARGFDGFLLQCFAGLIGGFIYGLLRVTSTPRPLSTR